VLAFWRLQLRVCATFETGFGLSTKSGLLEMKGFIQVFTTVEDKEDANKIGEMLLEKRLVGCVQIMGPVLSMYWWKGNVERAEEWLCLINSERSLCGQLEKAIREVHPYETPEIIAVPVVCGSENYLEWLRNELKKE